MSEGSSTAAASAIVSSGSATIPWVEKYRPSTIDQVAHQDEVVHTLRNALATGNVRFCFSPSLFLCFFSLLMSFVLILAIVVLQLPHLLFYGPPGTGKTSTILALARDLYGPEHYKSRVLELNASDERGIDVVRTKIKNFASLAVSTTAKK
jgi:replication factor C subunit 2/4